MSSGKFPEALGSRIGTGSIFCNLFSFLNLFHALPLKKVVVLYVLHSMKGLIVYFLLNFKFITTLVVGSYGFGIGGGFMSYGSRGFFPRGPQRNMVSGSKNYIVSVNV